MMKIRLNSKILLTFLEGRILLFLFSIIPLLGFAANGDVDQIKDSLEYNSSSKVNIYISEGATIYNSGAIYSGEDNSNSITEAVKKHKSEKIAAVSKSIEKKSKKKSQYLQHKHVPVIAEHFNCLPLDPASFFSKNNSRLTFSLPVSQQYIKIIGITTADYFTVSNIYRNNNSFEYLTIGIRKSDHRQFYTRPPPYLI